MIAAIIPILITTSQSRKNNFTIYIKAYIVRSSPLNNFFIIRNLGASIFQLHIAAKSPFS